MGVDSHGLPLQQSNGVRGCGSCLRIFQVGCLYHMPLPDRGGGEEGLGDGMDDGMGLFPLKTELGTAGMKLEPALAARLSLPVWISEVWQVVRFRP